MKNSIWVLCISLALCIALCFTGCAGIVSINKVNRTDKDKADKTETTESKDYEVYKSDYESQISSYLKDLSNNKYNGNTFLFAVLGDNTVTYDDKDSTVIKKDIEERNAAVEDTLDIKILEKTVDSNTLYNAIKSSVLSGSYYADALEIPQREIGKMALSDLLLNLCSLPGFNPSGSYYYKSSVTATGGGNQIYGVAGPATLNPDTLSCIYFNKAIVEQLGVESPYKLVKEGQWTADKFIEYSNLAVTLGEDYYSFGSQNVTPYLADIFYFGFGGRLCESNFGYYPTICPNENLVLKIRDIANINKRFGSSQEAVNNFTLGKTLFLVERLSMQKNIANTSFDWGVLPLPKLTAEQEDYYSMPYYEDTMFFSTVATATDYEEVADVIAAMNIMSYGYTPDNFITDYSYYYLRDNDSIDMLKYILAKPVYDFAYSFADSAPCIPNGTFMAVRNSAIGGKNLQNYINMYKKTFENTMYSYFTVN